MGPRGYRLFFHFHHLCRIPGDVYEAFCNESFSSCQIRMSAQMSPPGLSLRPKAQAIIEQIRLQELVKEAIRSGLIVGSDDAVEALAQAQEPVRTQAQAQAKPSGPGNKDGWANSWPLPTTAGLAATGADVTLVPDSGTFETSYQPGAQSSQLVTFSAPRVAVGLHLLDMSCDANIRFRIFASDINSDNFKIHFNSWSDSILYQGKASWLRMLGSDLNLLSGYFSTTEDHSRSKPQKITVRKTTVRKINFAHSFSEVPKVIVWVSEVDLDRKHSWHFDAKATNITSDDFVLRIEAHDDCILFSATFCWIAHHADLPGMTSGTFSTSDDQATKTKKGYKGEIQFPQAFDQPPEVIACINSWDFHHGRNIRAKVTTINQNTGLSWSLETWGDSDMRSLGGAFIAFDQVGGLLQDLRIWAYRPELLTSTIH